LFNIILLLICWISAGVLAFYRKNIFNFNCLTLFNKSRVTIFGCFCLVMLALTAAAQQTDTLKKSKDTVKTSADTGHRAALQPLLTTRVTGRVLDAATGKPLSYVNVNFTGTSNGVNTDSLGKFDLIAEGSFTSVTFSHMGYQSIVKSIKPGQQNGLNVSMRGSQTQLKGVTITSAKKEKYRNKGNPAVSLIQQIINHKDENRMESADYLQYNQYERIGMSFFNLSQKFINGKFFSKYKFMLDTTANVDGQKQTLLPVFLSEKLSDIYHRKEPSKNIQVLTAQKQINIIKFIDTAGLDVYLNRLYGNNLDIYSNNIFIIASQFLSPIADHSPNYYKFFIADTINTPAGKQVEVMLPPAPKATYFLKANW